LPLHPEAHRLNPTSLAMRSNFLDRMRVMLVGTDANFSHTPGLQ
jgi:hypothetical protein